MIHTGRRVSLSLGFGPPRARRGFLPLIAAAIGGSRAIYGAVMANQTKQRNKGYIGAAYREASQTLDTRQRAAGESSSESLAARGLLQGGSGAVSPIQTAMVGDVMKNVGTAPSTLAGQVKSDEGVQMGLERQDLEDQRRRAESENKTDYLNNIIGSVAQGAETAASVYSMGKDLQGPPGGGGVPMPQKSGPDVSSIYSATLGVSHPGNWFGGIVGSGQGPLDTPGSSWNKSTVVGEGQPDYDFNVAG